jgi:restriction endonuclease-like protein
MEEAAKYLYERQILWADRHGLKLCGSAPPRGRASYTTSLEKNLFEPLLPEARAEYETGDGGELGAGHGPGKMQAVHSSSALACNVFHYWRRIGRPDLIATACGISVPAQVKMAFEHMVAISPKFRHAPNLDVAFRRDGRDAGICGIEAKFTEPYSKRGPRQFSPKYFDQSLDPLWSGLANLRALANRLADGPVEFEFLDAAQLIKHVLGLKNEAGTGEYRLLYLWYDVAGRAGAKHTEEIERYSATALADGVPFSALSYQDVILVLARRHRGEHTAFVDYIVERYM